MKLLSTFLAAVCLIALNPFDSPAQELSKDKDGLFSTPEQSLSVPLRGGQSLVVSIPKSVRGNLSIVTDDDDKAQLRFRKRASASSRNTAFDFIDAITVVLTSTSGGANLSCRAPAAPAWSGDEYVAVELEITVPRQAVILVVAPKIHIAAEGPLDAITVTDAEEGVELLDILELVTLSSTQAPLKIDRVQGDISIQMKGGSLDMEDVESREQPTRIEATGADIRIQTLVGALDLNAEQGRIEIKQWEVTGEKSTVRVSEAPLQVELSRMTSGRLAISNRGDDIELSVPKDIQASFALTVEEGNSISATNLLMRPDVVLPKRLDLVTGNGAAEIRVTVRHNGSIYLRGYGEND